MVPIYAHLMAPAEMGVVTLAGTLAGLLSPALALGLDKGGPLQLIHLEDDSAAARAYASVMAFVGITALLGSLACAGALRAGWFSALSVLQPVAAAVALLLAATTLRDLATIVIHLRQQTRFLTAFNLCVDYGGSLLGVWLLWLGWGPAGILWAGGGAVGLGVVVALARTLRQLRAAVGFDRRLLAGALALGLPTLPIAFGQWTLQALDTVFLAHYHGAGVVGVYGVAISLASVVFLVLGAMNFVFLPTAASFWHQGPERFASFIERVLRLVTTALGLFVAGACFLGDWGVSHFAGRAYAEAARVLPLVVASWAGFTVMQTLQATPVIIERRTGPNARAFLAIAALNVALNFALIPRWSMRGAALATLVSYLVGILLMSRLARRSLPALRCWPPLVRPLVVTLATGALGLAFPVPAAVGVAGAGLLGLVCVAAYTGLARALGALTANDWRLLRSAAVAGSEGAVP